MFYYKTLWFTKVLKWKPVFFKSVLGSRSENTAPVTRGHVKSFKMKNEILLQLQQLFLYIKKV